MEDGAGGRLKYDARAGDDCVDCSGDDEGEWLKGLEVPEGAAEGAPEDRPDGGAFSRSSC